METTLYKTLKGINSFFLIAGPCVIENESISMNTAERLRVISDKSKIHLIYKSSFKKANRTSAESYSGPGLDEALKILQKVRDEFSLPILTDIHETTDVPLVQDVCDITQIPAFLSRQTALLQSAAASGKIVNIKKGQFMAPEDMKGAVNKVTMMDNQQILLTERGITFGYNNLIVDFRSFQIMHSYGFPIIFDVTHSLQKPSESSKSGGNPEFAGMMAQAAIATGYVDGLFIETHPEPSKALSDAACMLPLDKLPHLLETCLSIKRAISKG